MLEAKGEWILYTDADLSTPIEEIQKLCRAAREQDAAIAIGSRAVDRALVEVHQPALRELSGRCFQSGDARGHRAASSATPSADSNCISADAARRIFSQQKQDGFSFDVEDLLIAKKLGLRAVEVPVRWANVEGTKVRLTQGMMSFADLVRIRMDHR